MRNAVNVHDYMMDFLSISCAIMHDFANNGRGLSIFQENHHKHS